MYNIYKITNKINNKFYVGLTTRNLQRRLKEHMYNNDTGISSAIKKYGINNFTIESIDTAKTFKELENKEIKYIKELKPNYNLSSGGKTCFKHNKKTKEKISFSLKKLNIKWSDERKNYYSKMFSGENNPMYGKSFWTGKKHKKDTIKKMSISKIGKNNPMYGRKHTEETRLKIKKAWEKRKAS